jgi:SNF2 family DNA or RNA helicase
LSRQVRPSCKEKALLRILAETPAEQAVIFVERLATGRYLTQLLSHETGRAVFYRGGLSSGERQEATRRFRAGTTRYFVSTSAGAEGLNLQSASLLVNFDLHWNPLRLEQRIGRVHRFGQKRTVRVINLSAEGTIDDLVRTILFDKIDLFRMAVGHIDAILAQFNDEFDLEVEINDLISSARNRSQIVDGLRVLGDTLLTKAKEFSQGESFTGSLLDHPSRNLH